MGFFLKKYAFCDVADINSFFIIFQNGPKKLKFDLLKNTTKSVFEVFYISFFCSDSAKIPTIAVYIDLSSYST